MTRLPPARRIEPGVLRLPRRPGSGPWRVEARRARTEATGRRAPTRARLCSSRRFGGDRAKPPTPWSRSEAGCCPAERQSRRGPRLLPRHRRVGGACARSRRLGAIAWNRPALTTPERDWSEALERLSRGDRLAFAELARLVTGFLAGWRAYDFRDEWDDLVQEVILAGVEAHRARKLRQPAATLGYLRTTARFKFVDWLRRRRPEPLVSEDGEERVAVAWPPQEGPEGGFQIWDHVRRLPETQQRAVMLVYVEGMTYEEASEASGMPLGSLKRYLRDGLAALRVSLADFVDIVGPIPRAAPTDSLATPAEAGPVGARSRGTS